MTESDKLSTFSGRDQDWPDWAFEARSELVWKGVVSDDELIYIESQTSPIRAPRQPEACERSARVYHALARVCKGSARLIMLKVARHVEMGARLGDSYVQDMIGGTPSHQLSFLDVLWDLSSETLPNWRTP